MRALACRPHLHSLLDLSITKIIGSDSKVPSVWARTVMCVQWAFAAAETLADRICIGASAQQRPGYRNLTLSPEYLVFTRPTHTCPNPRCCAIEGDWGYPYVIGIFLRCFIFEMN